MAQEILKNPTQLMRDAVDTTDIYLRSAIESIDKEFGEGYAKLHPELVVGYMKTATSDYHSNIIAKAIFEIANNGKNLI